MLWALCLHSALLISNLVLTPAHSPHSTMAAFSYAAGQFWAFWRTCPHFSALTPSGRTATCFWAAVTT